jgi:hypothetical protein
LEPATITLRLRGSIATVGSFWLRRPVLQDSIVASTAPSYRA